MGKTTMNDKETIGFYNYTIERKVSDIFTLALTKIHRKIDGKWQKLRLKYISPRDPERA